MNHFRFLSFLCWAVLLTALSGCVIEDFDEPPIRDLDALTPNATIADLKQLHTIGSDDTPISDDLIVDAVVVADDESGAFFRQLAIADETGGITLRLNENDLYTEYPIGTRLFLKAQGLYVGDFNGLYQINGAPDEEIESLLIPEFVFVGERDVEVLPTVVRLEELEDGNRFDQVLNTLITLEGVQFIDRDTEVTYADAVNRESVNLTLQDCLGNDITVRTSGFADFADVRTPSGNGTLTAVLTVFGNTKQLVIRDTSDVRLDGSRCGNSGGEVGGQPISIADLRARYTGAETDLPADLKITGTVISDRTSNSVFSQILYLQDATGGIAAFFTDEHNYSLGQEISIEVSNLSLEEFNGLLQIQDIPLARSTSEGAGPVIEPTLVTITELRTNFDAYESTLVKISDVTLSGNSTFEGAVTVADGTGTIDLFTRGSASFASEPLVSGQVDLTAIASFFSNPQLIIRNLSDVEGDGTVNPPNAETAITTADLRARFAAGETAVEADKFLEGIVISDQNAGSTTGQNAVIQDANGGIVVRFNAEHSLALGDRVRISIGNRELSEFNDLLQVNGVPNGSVEVLSSGNTPDVRTTTVADLLANLERWESTLVRIENATISGGTTFVNEMSVNDGTDTVVLFSRNSSEIIGTAVPSGSVTLTVIVSEYRGTPQIILRNTGDIQNP